MGWGDISGHEGWGPAVFEGGWFSVGSNAEGALVQHPDVPLVTLGLEAQTRDGRTALGWRAQCECGWTGPLHEPIAGDDLTVYGDPPPELEEEMNGEWRKHALPVENLDLVRQEAAAVAAAQNRLGEAVATARAGGSSWADIGTAVGITRQSAHERWGGRNPKDAR